MVRYRRWAGWPWWYDSDGKVYVVDDFGSLVQVRNNGRGHPGN